MRKQTHFAAAEGAIIARVLLRRTVMGRHENGGGRSFLGDNAITARNASAITRCSVSPPRSSGFCPF